MDDPGTNGPVVLVEPEVAEPVTDDAGEAEAWSADESPAAGVPLRPEDRADVPASARPPGPPADARPATECLKDVLVRLVPYWEDVIVADLRAGKTVSVTDLDPRFSQPAATSVAVSALPSSGGNILDRELNEKQLLKQALAAAAGNRTRAAELMGISRRTLHRKLLQWPELDPGPENA